MRNTLLFVFLLTFLSSQSFAEITPMGTGMLFGDNHSFYLTAPQGWVLDTESGSNQGLHMIFYPEDKTWSSSPVIAYGQSVTKDTQTQNIEDQVRFIVQNFSDNGSPNYKATRQPPTKLPNESKAEIYFYEGDQWGNFEAVAYFDEKETINFLVYNARNNQAFDQNISAFYSILHTYKNVFSRPETMTTNAISEFVQYAEEDVSTFEGQEYETAAMTSLGPKIADFMSGCASYVTDQEVIPFDLVVKVEHDGNISEAYIDPVNSLSTCFKGLMVEIKYPPHMFNRFYQHVHMEIR